MPLSSSPVIFQLNYETVCILSDSIDEKKKSINYLKEKNKRVEVIVSVLYYCVLLFITTSKSYITKLKVIINC